MKSKQIPVLIVVFAALLVSWALPGGAAARQLLGTMTVTFYGGLIKLNGADGAEFSPQNPPCLCDIRLYDDRSLQLGAAGSGGGETFECHEIFSYNSLRILAFQRPGELDWLFLSALSETETEVLGFMIEPGKGFLVIPYDVGDTRRARAAEMAGGKQPQMTSAIFSGVVEWLNRKLSGKAVAEMLADE